MFPALRSRAFVALWLGTFFSNVGGWMHNFASRWLIYDLTGDTWLLGLDALLSGLTTAALLPFGGVLADRFSRRRILIVCNVIAAANVATLAAASAVGTLRVWHILVVTFVNGVVNAAMVPANQSLLPTVVARADLSNAIALNSLQFNVARVFGPILALVAYLLGPVWCFGVNAASFLVLAVVLSALRLAVPPRALGESAWRSLAAGARYVGRRRDLFVILAFVLVTAFFSAPAVSMLPALVKGVYGLSAESFGYVQAAFGVGSVIGALVMAVRHERTPQPWRVAGLLAVLGVCEVGLCYAQWFIAAAALVMVIGIMLIATMVRLGAAMQYGVADEVRGRVMSLQSLSFRGGQALGSFTAGVLAGGLPAWFTGIGLRWAFGWYGLTLVLAVAALATIIRARGVRYVPVAEDEARPA
jgi:MFS family permease